jgi:hypothetical protein
VADPVIELVRELAANPGAGPQAVARNVGGQFARVESESTKYFDILRSSAPLRDGAVASLEMRVKRDTGTVKLYVVTVDTGKHCLRDKDISGAFGPKFEFAPPSPRAAGSVPNYHSYKYATHEISFGLERSGSKCCSKVVIEFVR